MQNGMKLSEHIFKKGVFITPMNNAIGDKLKLTSWHKETLPEFIWLGCLFQERERVEALKLAMMILKELNRLDNSIEFPVFSGILNMSKDIQDDFFKYIKRIAGENILVPLTLLYTHSDYPTFTENFCNPSFDIKDRQEILSTLLKNTYNSQSELTTDIKFLVLYFMIIRRKLFMPKESVDMLIRYPETDYKDDIMKTIRSSIRAAFGAICGEASTNHKDFINEFWERISVMSECDLFGIKWEPEQSDLEEYINYLYEIVVYLSDHFTTMEPINDKASVIIGILTYSYKRLRELYDYNMCNSICARSIIRVLLEDYIMIKYLIKQEQNKPNIWRAFQKYGLGIYKEVSNRARDIGKEFPHSHIVPEYIDTIVNSVVNEQYLNIDTSYFDKQNIREKAISVDEKELWGRFYDYESSYEHGLWGAILESSTLICNNPSHQYHYVPDVKNEQKLKSVWPDAVMLMNKTLNFVNIIYQIPEEFLLKVNNYEKQLFEE